MYPIQNTGTFKILCYWHIQNKEQQQQQQQKN